MPGLWRKICPLAARFRYYDRQRFIAKRAHGKAKILFARVYRKRPADRAGGCGRAADWNRRTGIRAVFQFWRTAAAAAAAQQRWVRWRIRRWRWLVRWRSVRALPAAGAQAGGARGFFQGAATGKTRDRAGAQRAGARRCHGGLA